MTDSPPLPPSPFPPGEVGGRAAGADADLAAWLKLSLIPGLGPRRQRQLLSAFGLPQQILSASIPSLAGIIGAKLAAELSASDPSERIAATLAWALEPGNHLLTLADPAYPARLLTIPDPPCVLYAKGDLGLLDRPALAVVGARSATPQGLANARAFASALSAEGMVIVSGLALGIDAAAHTGALENGGGTIAVIGTGADRIYPARNRDLARRISTQGLILSEFPLGTPALAGNFPRRNRIISGLALGVLVVEAALGSGSLITAREAIEQGREVFAIPGSIHSPLSKGCHRLIRDGAKLVETAADVLEELALPSRERATEPNPPPLGADEPPDPVLSALGHDPVDLDTLAQRCGLTPEALYAILLDMELDGRISRLPGGRYQRL